MFRHFAILQWKSLYRSASFKTAIWYKALMIFGALYCIFGLLGLGFGAYFLIEEAGLGEPLRVVNRYMVYYLALDLMVRYMMQKMPVTNIKPLLYLPISKGQVINFSLGKTVVSFFNWTHAFFLIPFSVILLLKGHGALQVIGWHLALMALIYVNNFLNVMINNKDGYFYGFVALVALAGTAQYQGWVDLSLYAAPIFDFFYDRPWSALLPWGLAVVLYFASYSYFKRHMFLDGGLADKTAEARTENLDWLDRFGNLGTFLKNDIKLIKRNKRSRTAVIMGFFFIFYGLLFMTGAIETYDHPYWKIFAGIFVTGGFLFSFGQYVPSWDSSYYPLMMSQNIRYREYLASKWYLIVLATVITTILSTFYIYFGWEAYAAVLVAAIYNVGVNSYLVLWGGAYVKTPIELTSNKKAFGDKQAFNAKTLLLTLPKLLLPIGVYALGDLLAGPKAGYALVAGCGLLGFVFRERVFKTIEQVYKREKYRTLLAYKQK